MSFVLSWSNLGDTDGETNECDLKLRSQAMYQHYQPLAGSIHVYRYSQPFQQGLPMSPICIASRWILILKTISHCDLFEVDFTIGRQAFPSLRLSDLHDTCEGTCGTSEGRKPSDPIGAITLRTPMLLGPGIVVAP